MELVWESADHEKGAIQASGAFAGIDLGTSNSCIALWHPEKHRAKVIKSRAPYERRTTPSVVYHHSSREWSISHRALDDAASGQGVSVTAVKRVIGLRHGDKGLEGIDGAFGFNVVEGREGEVVVLEARAGDGSTVRCTPEEVSSRVLSELRQAAEAHLQSKPFPGLPKHVDRAVITVPAHFTEAQKDATRRAAQSAGFKHVRLLNEPFAAAMAYGLFVAGTKKVLTFDMGGGTTDVSVMGLVDGTFEVLALQGDNRLGGEDMDQGLLEYVLSQSRVSTASQDLRFLSKLRAACSAAKVSLSSSDAAVVDVAEAAVTDGVAPGGNEHDGSGRGGGSGGGKNGGNRNAGRVVRVTRQKFEELIKPIIGRARAVVEAALAGAGLSPSDIDEVVLVGGCSRIPAVRAMLQGVFGEKELCTSVNPDEAVAEGAAIRAAILAGVDPAMMRDILMLDALPLSIGIETDGGGFETILPKNSSIPCRGTKYFQLAESTQKAVTVRLLEGGDEQGSEGKTLLASFNIPVQGHVVEAERDDDGDGNPQQDAGEGAAVPGESGGEEELMYLVPITVEMNDKCVLRVSVGEPDEGEGQREDGPVEMTNFYILAVYCLVLLGLYIGCKIYFADVHIAWTAPASDEGGEPVSTEL